MKTNFLLLTCSIRKNTQVAKEIQKNHGVLEAIPVYGTFDCIVTTHDLSPKETNDLITSTIRPLNHVSAIIPLYTSPQNLPKPHE